MLKAIAKKAINKRRKNKPIVTIDGVFNTSDLLTIAGWLVIKADIIPEESIVIAGNEAIIKTYQRKDVEQAIEVQAGYCCYGFSIAIPFSGRMPTNVVIAEKEIVIAEQQKAASLTDTVIYLSEKEQQQIISLSKVTEVDDSSFYLTIDEMVQIGEDKVFIRGWSNDPLNKIAELVISDGKKTTPDI